MPSTRKQKAKEKRSRHCDVMSDIENSELSEETEQIEQTAQKTQCLTITNDSNTISYP